MPADRNERSCRNLAGVVLTPVGIWGDRPYASKINFF